MACCNRLNGLSSCLLFLTGMHYVPGARHRFPRNSGKVSRSIHQRAGWPWWAHSSCRERGVLMGVVSPATPVKFQEVVKVTKELQGWRAKEKTLQKRNSCNSNVMQHSERYRRLGQDKWSGCIYLKVCVRVLNLCFLNKILICIYLWYVLSLASTIHYMHIVMLPNV